MQKLFFGSVLSILMSFTAVHAEEVLSLFPIENYNQTITDWITPEDIDYNKPLLTKEQQAIRFKDILNHYAGAESPWNSAFVNRFYSQISPDNLTKYESDKVNGFSNQHKLPEDIGYGSNFRPHDDVWFERIKNNMNLDQFKKNHFHSSNRVIAVHNIQGRSLPADEVHFYSYTIAGQGYPFDNLQEAVLWAGTPLYVVGETKDHAWSLVLTPSFFIQWVKNQDLAYVNQAFVNQWQSQSKKHLIAILKTELPMIDTESHLNRFSGYIGMVLPGKITQSALEALVPVADENHHAHIRYVKLAKDDAVPMPLSPTPQHFIKVMNQLIGRPYGWGGMYFYNDCASELKNLYAPFGIWLPVHSSNQVDEKLALIKQVDLSAETRDKRLDFLIKEGHPFMTVVYVGGHVFMYLGAYHNPSDPSGPAVALSYQNMWGLHPEGKNHRAVIGKAVIFPILKRYPENKHLVSHASAAYFQVAFLDDPTLLKEEEHLPPVDFYRFLFS